MALSLSGGKRGDGEKLVAAEQHHPGVRTHSGAQEGSSGAHRANKVSEIMKSGVITNMTAGTFVLTGRGLLSYMQNM